MNTHDEHTGSTALLRLHSRDEAGVVRAFAVYSLVFRTVGVAWVHLVGIPWLALSQALAAAAYGLMLWRYRSVPTRAFLGFLGPEWVLWGIAMVLGFGIAPFFHLHAALVASAILLLLHNLPPRERIFFFLVPVAVPVPCLAILHRVAPELELSLGTSGVFMIVNQVIGISLMVVTSGLAMLDHAQARRLAEERAEAQTRLVEDLSHELRTPIATILTAAQGAALARDERQEVAHYIRWIEESARAGGRLIESMLDLATLDRGRRPDPRPTPLVEATRATFDRLRPLAESNGLELVLHVDPRAEVELERSVDAVSLGIVLQNLIVNALDHSPAGTAVEVRLSGAGGAPRIDVEDHGDGIAAEDLPRVFDRMWRADAVRSRDHERYGLGLSIARRHAEWLGATIEARSQLGVGSIFSLVFRPGKRED